MPPAGSLGRVDRSALLDVFGFSARVCDYGDLSGELWQLFLQLWRSRLAKHRLDQRLPAEIMAFAALTKAHG
jgi:hypothetical protein